jgi:hypothetical protein
MSPAQERFGARRKRARCRGDAKGIVGPPPTPPQGDPAHVDDAVPWQAGGTGGLLQRGPLVALLLVPLCRLLPARRRRCRRGAGLHLGLLCCGALVTPPLLLVLGLCVELPAALAGALRCACGGRGRGEGVSGCTGRRGRHQGRLSGACRLRAARAVVHSDSRTHSPHCARGPRSLGVWGSGGSPVQRASAQPDALAGRVQYSGRRSQTRVSRAASMSGGGASLNWVVRQEPSGSLYAPR